MARIVEMFNRGLVPISIYGFSPAAVDPFNMEPGTFQASEDFVYTGPKLHLEKAPAFVKIANKPGTSDTNCKGIRVLEFPDLDPIVLGHYGAKLYTAPPTYVSTNLPTMTEISGAPIEEGTGLDTINYQGTHYVFNGVSRSLALYGEDGAITFGPHGLEPVSLPPTVATTSGSWPSVLGGSKYYFFLTTEVYDPEGPHEIESAFVGKPAYAYPSSSNSVLVTPPNRHNTAATEYRIYMYGPCDSATFTDDMLASFWRVGKGTFSSAGVPNTVTLGSSMTTTTKLAGAASAYGALPEFTNKANMVGGTSKDGVVATAYGVNKAEILDTFGFALGGAGYTVGGLELRLRWRAYKPAAAVYHNYDRVLIELSFDGGSTYPVTRTIWCPEHTGLEYYSIGGPGFLWDQTSLDGAKFDSNAFKVRMTYLGYTGSTSFHNGVEFDCVEALVTGSSTAVPTDGPRYPVVGVSLNGLNTIFPANMPPLAGSRTGDMFEGQMVLNYRGGIAYSLPDAPHYFPEPYRAANLGTRNYDETTFIRRLGSKMIIGQRGKLIRLNYLPSGTDADFSMGKAYDIISEAHGIVGADAGCIFSAPGYGPRLAFVSYDGLFMTDGQSVSPLCTNIDWSYMCDGTQIEKSYIVDIPSIYTLVVVYGPTSTDGISKSLWLNYHPLNLAPDGSLKASGPVNHAQFQRFCTGRITNTAHAGKWVLFGIDGPGDLTVQFPNGYYAGNVIFVSANVAQIRTRRIHLGSELGGCGQVQAVWVQVASLRKFASGGYPEIEIVPLMWNVNRTAIAPPNTSKKKVIMGSGLYRFDFNFAADAVSFLILMSSASTVSADISGIYIETAQRTYAVGTR